MVHDTGRSSSVGLAVEDEGTCALSVVEVGEHLQSIDSLFSPVVRRREGEGEGEGERGREREGEGEAEGERGRERERERESERERGRGRGRGKERERGRGREGERVKKAFEKQTLISSNRLLNVCVVMSV